MDPDRNIIYKQTEQGDLALHLFEPAVGNGTARPAIVFFFGGGWVGGTPTQFYPQCRYLASRGMLAISAEYRVKNTHGVTPFECVRDGKSAIRWVRAHASQLDVEPTQIVAGGGSAGGHVAACTGVVLDVEEPTEDRSISSRPSAMVLFNPVLNLDWSAWGVPAKRHQALSERFGGQDPLAISPQHHVCAGLPPTLILHGEADATVPFSTAKGFAKAMQAAGNRCELIGYPGEGHGFFNFGRGTGEQFYETLKVADQFLVSLDLLQDP